MPVLDSFPSQLECSTIVFRVLKSSWFDEEEISSRAFTLGFKKGEWEKGLSVLNNKENGMKAISNPKAIVSFHVGRIRDVKTEDDHISLDVIPDGEIDTYFDENKIVHGEIRGMPPPDSIENILIAERVANALLNLIKNRPFVYKKQPKQ